MAKEADKPSMISRYMEICIKEKELAFKLNAIDSLKDYTKEQLEEAKLKVDVLKTFDFS